jgi:hypothetical protein
MTMSRRLAGLLAAVFCTLLASASLAVGQAQAGNCYAGGPQAPAFLLATDQACWTTTTLRGNLQVYDSDSYISALSGTTSGSSSAKGVEGTSNSTAPSGETAGVYGLSMSQNDKGPGVFGIHFASTGTSAGVYGITNSPSGSGVYGEQPSTGPGLFTAGVSGVSRSVTNLGPGVWGLHSSSIGTVPAVQGETNSTTNGAIGTKGIIVSTNPGAGSAAVYGENRGAGGYGVGVWGSQNGSGYGVYGTAPDGIGVVGIHQNASGTSPGVSGDSSSTAQYAVGVQGRITSASAGPGSAAVRGVNNGAGATGIGVWGSHAGSGYGVYGTSANGYGVVGESSKWAGYFFGNVTVTGTLFKGAGAFKIDHPLDPAHKYLQHSFVESPEMKNVYDGIATTNARGFAVVRLPHYFQALNERFRYQLTSLSGLQQVAVATEIANNRFTIQSEKPHSRVSWQVTGVRHDAYAKAHPIRVIEEKTAAEQGKYLYPQGFGKPASDTVQRAPAAKPVHRKGA